MLYDKIDLWKILAFLQGWSGLKIPEEIQCVSSPGKNKIQMYLKMFVTAVLTVECAY